MALTAQSFAAAARRKTARAKKHVEAAEADLKQANRELENAIPLRDTEQVQQAHERTQEAEKAVAVAAQDLEVATELLDQQLADQPSTESPHAGNSGEGVKGLLHTLRNSRQNLP